MNVKKTGKRLAAVALVVLAMVSCLGIGALAAANSMEIQAVMNLSMPIKYNGEVQHFTDVNGKAVYPLVYEGTTYLPVRAVCTLAGIPVEWDQETGSVLLGEGDRKDVNENIYKDSILGPEWCTDPAKLIVNNEGHKAGINLSESVGTNQSFGWLELGKQYNVLHCYVESDTAGTLYFTTDNWYNTTIKDATVLQAVDVQSGTPIEVNLSVTGHDKVYIGWACNGNGTPDLRIVDMYLK